jgi:hypothetical protein
MEEGSGNRCGKLLVGRVGSPALPYNQKLLAECVLLLGKRHELFMQERMRSGSGSEAIACTTEIWRFVIPLISRTSPMISDTFSQVSG